MRQSTNAVDCLVPWLTGIKSSRTPAKLHGGTARWPFLDPAAPATPNIPPSWNVAPTDPLPVVRYDARAGERSLDVMRWGLVPFWAKDIKVGFANINAKGR